MKLFTVQNKKFYDMVSKNGYAVTNPVYSMAYPYAKFRRAYEWLTDKMDTAIGGRPSGVTYPVWGWQNLEKESVLHHRYGKTGASMCLLTLDVPEKEVLLSDFHLWNIALCGNYVPLFHNSELAEREKAVLRLLPEPDRREYIESSWDRVFDVSGECLIQASFWCIKKDYVRDVEFFTESKSCFYTRGHECLL